jgi:subtilase family serine protease
MRTAKTSLSTAAVVGALVATGLMAAPSANATPKRHTFTRTAPTWVGRADSLGRVAPTAKSTFRVYLAPQRGIEALKADVAKVSDPKSADYRHFLSAAQFHARYDATSATVAKVSNFLRSNRLTVTSVEAHHRYLAVSGANADVQQALNVTLEKFRHRGQVVQANTHAVSLPADVASSVLTVSGLDTTPNLVKHNSAPQKARKVARQAVAPPPDGFRNARPCSRYYGQVAAKYKADYKTPLPKFQGKTLPYSVCGYTGPYLRSAYQGANKAGLSGKGVTVAITDAYAAPTIASDANRYAEAHGDGSYTPGQLTQVTPKTYTNQADCDPSGWYGEETLDVEAVHAMAPDSNIRYYASASCFDNDFLATLNKVVDQNKASLVSNSWSDVEQNETPDAVAAYEQIFLQGALQGIGFMFSSGDSGDELAHTSAKQVDYPASDPYATAVGGTSDAIGADGTFKFQTGWGTVKYNLNPEGNGWNSVGFTSGAGGGASSLFNRPSYQNGVVPGSNGAGRGVPDVGLDADPTTGMLIGETQTFSDGVYYDEYRLGGTSLASPLMAGQTALSQQHAGGRLGFLNPTIYSSKSKPAFTDVAGSPSDVGNVRADFANTQDESGGVLYSVRLFNHDSSLSTAPGWDNVTGVGSPNANWLTTPTPAS